MKKLFLVVLMLMLCFTLAFSQTHDVKVVFVSESGYSNNLFIDNLTVGTQMANDVGVVSINNIPADTSYAMGSEDVVIIPNVSVINIGRNTAASSAWSFFSSLFRIRSNRDCACSGDRSRVLLTA